LTTIIDIQEDEFLFTIVRNLASQQINAWLQKRICIYVASI